MRIPITIAAACMMAGMPVQAQHSSDVFHAARAYMKQLRARTASSDPVRGPDQVMIEQAGAASTETVPSARLKQMLSGCRLGGASGGYAPGGPPAVEWRQYLECLGPAGEAKTAYVTVRTNSAGDAIESVKARFGGPMQWLPPAPGNPSGIAGYSDAEFQQDREIAAAFLATLTGGKGSAGPVPIQIRDNDWNVTDATPARAADLLKPCKELYSHRSQLSLDPKSQPHHAVRVVWKCDPRSSAPEDLDVWVGISNGKVDSMAIASRQDYPIPAP